MNDNILSVCLLVYNHEDLIEKTIESILDQNFSDFELIISDDNSTDNSYQLCDSFARKDKRIKLIRTKTNLGMAGNANFAISESKGEWIALLHHDDILKPNCFDKWLEIALNFNNVGFVFNDYKETKLSSKKSMKIKKSFCSSMEGKYFLSNYLLKYWGCPVRGTALLRRKHFDEIGGMNEEFGLLADVDLWMRLSSRWDVGYVNEPLINVRQGWPENYPKTYTDFSWKREFILIDIHSSNINRYNYPKFFKFTIKRLVFRNRVSIEIIKWLLYGTIKRKTFIIKSFPAHGHKDEIIYSRIVTILLKVIS